MHRYTPRSVVCNSMMVSVPSLRFTRNLGSPSGSGRSLRSHVIAGFGWPEATHSRVAVSPSPSDTSDDFWMMRGWADGWNKNTPESPEITGELITRSKLQHVYQHLFYWQIEVEILILACINDNLITVTVQLTGKSLIGCVVGEKHVQIGDIRTETLNITVETVIILYCFRFLSTISWKATLINRLQPLYQEFAPLTRKPLLTDYFQFMSVILDNEWDQSIWICRFPNSRHTSDFNLCPQCSHIACCMHGAQYTMTQ